jgi:hypothetical protein
MTKEAMAMLEAAAARVEQAIDVLEEAQEILAQDDLDETFEFPVGIIFSAQTSLRVVSELVKDVRAQAKRERGATKGTTKKSGRKGAARKGSR